MALAAYDVAMVNIRISLERSGYRFPDGKPVKAEALPDGRTTYTMADGRVMTPPRFNDYLIDYQSNFVGAKDGDTYQIPVSFSGLSSVRGFVECWNYEISELRNYAFDKIVRVISVDGGWSLTGEELRLQLGGELRTGSS